MIQSTSSSASSLLDLSSSTPGNANATGSEDPAASFADVLHGHEAQGNSTSPDSTASDTGADVSASQSSEAAHDTTSSLQPSPMSKSGSISAALKAFRAEDAKHLSDADVSSQEDTEITGTLSSLGLKSGVLAAPAGKNCGIMGNPLAAKSSGPAANTGTSSNGATTWDLSLLLAQAAILAAHPARGGVAAPPPTTPADPAAASSTAAKSAVNTSGTFGGECLPTLAPLAWKLGNGLPLSGTNTGTGNPSSKEKKSPAISADRSFLHEAALSCTGISSSSSLAGALSLPLLKASDNQTNTLGGGGKTGVLAAPSSGASTSAGTTNVETEGSMNMDLNTALLNGHGASSLLVQTPADIHIQLSSNADFEHALQQVVQVAEATNASPSAGPLRIAMELQTPPGAIVNVYISRHDDQYRAQLSTNDLQALSWVQDKIESLRQSGDLPVDVHWLPAQTESSSISTSGSEQHTWDGDSREQFNRRQAEDESRQNNQPKRNTFFNLDEPFMSTFEVLGRAA